MQWETRWPALTQKFAYEPVSVGSSAGMTVVDAMTYFLVQNAPAGEWQGRFDPGTADSIDHAIAVTQY